MLRNLKLYTLHLENEGVKVVEHRYHELTAVLYMEKSTKVQVGKDQEKAQPERDSHSKNRGGKKPN